MNTAADDTNRLAVRSNAVLFTGVEAGGGGTGDVRFVVNKEADADTASLLFQSGFSGRAEIGLAGDTDFVFKVSADGSAWTEAIRIDKDTGLATLASDPSGAMHAATKQYVDAIVAAQDAMVFKGVVDCSANPNYPAADRGWTYRVSVAGKIGGGSGVNVEAGDLLLCLTDGTASGNQATVGASWSIAQVNLDGAVIGPASVTDGVPVLFDGMTGKLIRASTFSAFKTALALVKADVGLGSVLNVQQREQLTANRTYYVRTDGSNSNTGLADNAGGAFLTIQKAMDVIAALDLSIYNVTVNVRAGTYTAGLVLATIIGAGTVSFIGDETTPSNVHIDVASSSAVSSGTAMGAFVIAGFKLDFGELDGPPGAIPLQGDGTQQRICRPLELPGLLLQLRLSGLRRRRQCHLRRWARVPPRRAVRQLRDVQHHLEPFRKEVESEESVVIPCLASESLTRGAKCGRLNIAVLPSVAACAIPVI